MTKTFPMSEELANEVIAYLGQRPFSEVSNLILRMQGEYADGTAKDEPQDHKDSKKKS